MNRGKQITILAGLGVGATLLLTDASSRSRKRSRIARKPLTDHRLAARVAVELDEQVEHSRGIQVFATDNRITLRGIALRHELADVMNAIRSVKAVKGFRNNLELRDSPGKVFSLQA